MIYTVTMNPALDYVVQTDKLTKGTVNRLKEEHIFAGGKGINVSMVLKALEMDTAVISFIAGFTGKALEEGLQQAELNSVLIPVEEGMTRINMKLKAEEETEINGIGPKIEEKDIEILLNKVKDLQAGDMLVISGSVPNSVKDDIYERIVCALPEGVEFAADAEKKLLLPLLKYHPFLIKPNHHELADIFDTKIETKEQLLACAAKLQEMGARNVLVSMSKDGAILLDENGNVHERKAAEGNMVSSIGAGDSMVAGFIAGWLKYHDYDEALLLGTACGSATAFHNGIAGKEDIEEVLKTLK